MHPSVPMYGIILLDFSMSEMDGAKCAERIGQIFSGDNASIRPRICCITVYNSEKVKQRALAAGMDSFFSKPIFKKDLQDELFKAGLIKNS